MHRIEAKELKPGMRVLLSDGSERELTSVGEYTSFGMPMFGWRWMPGLKKTVAWTAATREFLSRLLGSIWCGWHNN